jgi:dihydroorotate dehydrogenase (NAD+) catalytic subunit
MVYQVVDRVKIPVIGVGGIMTGEDALEYLITGAKAVEVGMANFVDPQSTLRVIQDLEAFCKSHGIERIEELIGSLKARDLEQLD